MYHSSPSPVIPHEDRIRTLLDARNARNHNAYDSVSLISDSPSIYSHQQFSPRTVHGLELDTAGANSAYAPSPRSTDMYSEPRSPLSDRERLADPYASSLDMDDDSSYHGSFDEDEQSTIEGQADDSRMSYLGPKMKVISKAPWEMGEEDVLEEEDDGGSYPYPPSATTHSRTKTKTPKGDGIIKGLGFIGRASTSTRPSVDSSRSGSGSSGTKKSFETSSSLSAGGALSALAQASMPTHALAYPSAKGYPAQSTLRPKHSAPHLRARADNDNFSLQIPTPTPRGPPSIHSFDISRTPRDGTPTPPELRRNYSDNSQSHSSASSARTSSSNDDYSHPFANPKFALAYGGHTAPRDDPLSSPHPGGPRELSDATLTSSSTITGTESSVFSSHTADSDAFTPDTSMSSSFDYDSDRRSTKSSGIQRKMISSPLAVTKTTRRFDSVPAPGRPDERDMLYVPPNDGYATSPTSPTFTLISLQEAQAQRDRSRSTTMGGANFDLTPAPPIPFPDSDVMSIRSQDMSMNPVARARARTTSGGSRPKRAFHVDIGQEPVPTAEAPPAGKTVKHKKSGGFMRLFRDKSGNAPPPVPQLADSQPAPQLPSTVSVPRLIPRAPVPSITESMLSDERERSAYVQSNASRENAEPLSTGDMTTRKTSPRPPLSIFTGSSGSLNKSTSSLAASDRPQTSLASTPSPRGPAAAFPNSAPADKTSFEGLSLRPVSQIFSSHFRAHLGGSNSSTIDSAGPQTPGMSSVGMLSPFQADEASGFAGGDATAVIGALQNQIASARKQWQRQVWDLEGQVRALKAEVERLRDEAADKEGCEMCGRAAMLPLAQDHAHSPTKGGGVLNRPRARTGAGGRFVSGD